MILIKYIITFSQEHIKDIQIIFKKGDGKD